MKANRQAMAYLALALKPIELLRLLTRAVTTEWAEGEAWKVMKQVQDIYQPNEVLSIAEGRFKLAIIRMGTQGHLTYNDMIGVIFTIAPEKYRATLNVTVENHEAT